MAAPKSRNNDDRLKHLSEVSRLYLAGKYQHEIATELEVTRQQIGYDLKVLRRLWHTSAIRDFDEARGRELAKIDRVEREFWDAWERSCDAARIENTKARRNAGGESVEKSTRTEEQVGDPRFLQGVERCIERRCKLLGLDAPTRSELTGAGGAPIGMGFDEIVKILRGVNDSGADT